MSGRTKKPPRPARPDAAALFEVVAGNSDTKTYSTATATKQGRAQPKPRKRILGGDTAGKVPVAETFSVSDGRTGIGTVRRYGDARNGRWVAYDLQWRALGSYSTMEAAVAALPKVKKEA
jgi:hypothetical protein